MRIAKEAFAAEIPADNPVPDWVPLSWRARNAIIRRLPVRSARRERASIRDRAQPAWDTDGKGAGMIMDFVRSALSLPAVYNGYQSLVGTPRCHRRFIAEMVRPRPRDRMLEIGCGIGTSVRYLPDSVKYVGIDINEAYIESARKDYGDRGDFLCVDIASARAETLGMFDLAFSFGVLHHLSDAVATSVIDLVRKVVRPGGRFVTIDPCYESGQNPIARLLIDNDRGQFVRYARGYADFMWSLGEVRADIYHDLLRVPYTQVVLEIDLR